MVIQKNAFWRKQYHKELLSAIQDLLGKPSDLPEYLTLPVSSKSSMFEFGGSKYSSGTAMVVATPSGFPNAAIALKQRKVNGLHAADDGGDLWDYFCQQQRHQRRRKQPR